MIPGTRTGLSEEQFLIQRKDNACSCGGGCPRCVLQAKRAVSAHAYPLEWEADVAADRVVHPKAASFGARAAEPPVQRQAEPEEEKEEEQPLQGKFESMQRHSIEEEEEEVLQGKFSPSEAPAQLERDVGEAENRTGMPRPLKAGLEALSGMDLSGVRVQATPPNLPNSMPWRIPKGKRSTWVQVRRSIYLMKVGTRCSRCRGE